jgi:hypothetical protein
LFIRDSAIDPLVLVKLQIPRAAGIRINDGNDRNEPRLERRPHRPKTKTAFNKKLFVGDAFSQAFAFYANRSR